MRKKRTSAKHGALSYRNPGALDVLNISLQETHVAARVAEKSREKPKRMNARETISIKIHPLVFSKPNQPASKV